MPHVIATVAMIVALVCTLVYNHALLRLYKVIESEQPGWVAVRGSLDFFYESFPRAFNPNVGLAVLKVAFSSRARELQSPSASAYVRCIRLCLPLGAACFVVVGTVSA